MKCPYNQLELLTALMTAAEKIDKTEQAKLDDFITRLGTLVPKEPSEFNKATADHHGITVDQLVSSPAFRDLREDYILGLVDKLVNMIQTDFDLTHKEAWAIIAAKDMLG